MQLGATSLNQPSLSRQDVENIVSRAVNDATDLFNLEKSNAEAAKLAFQNQIRNMMQDLVSPLVD